MYTFFSCGDVTFFFWRNSTNVENTWYQIEEEIWIANLEYVEYWFHLLLQYQLQSLLLQCCSRQALRPPHIWSKLQPKIMKRHYKSWSHIKQGRHPQVSYTTIRFPMWLQTDLLQCLSVKETPPSILSAALETCQQWEGAVRADWRTVLCGGVPKDCHSRWDPREGLNGFFCCLLSDCNHCHPRAAASNYFSLFHDLLLQFCIVSTTEFMSLREVYFGKFSDYWLPQCQSYSLLNATRAPWQGYTSKMHTWGGHFRCTLLG